MKHKIHIIILLVLGLASASNAQVVFFDGLGRGIVQNQSLDGNITNGDTVSSQKTIGGYSLFDLGFNIMPSKKFHGRAVLRAKNEFGQFFGTGTSMNFREIQLQGIVADGIYYQLGDIDLGLTPYTVFNFEESYNEFESSIFKSRRDILEYENFNHGNKWRVQGAQTELSLVPLMHLSRINIKAFGARTKPSDNLGVPDRLLSGGSLGIEKDSMLFLNGNYTGYFDNPGLEDNFKYSNHVFTGDVKVRLLDGDSKLFVQGETGLSSFDFTDLTTDSVTSFNDHFYDFKLNFEKGSGLKAKVGYKDVGPQFSSPSAQTPRVSPLTAPLIFGSVLSGTASREQLLYDRLGQENLYNAAISPVLFGMQPQFNNAMPYGEATPNRRGLYLNLEAQDSAGFVSAALNGALLSEIIGEGTVDKRSFTVVYGGVKAAIGNKQGWDKELNLTVGGKYEITSRSGNAPVDFNSMLIDAGIEAEVVDALFLSAGYKLLSASGEEFIGTRDGFNGLSNYSILNYDQTEGILAFSGTFKFSDFSIFRLDYNMVNLNNNNDNTMSYNMNQLFMNYTIKF